MVHAYTPATEPWEDWAHLDECHGQMWMDGLTFDVDMLRLGERRKAWVNLICTDVLEHVDSFSFCSQIYFLDFLGDHVIHHWSVCGNLPYVFIFFSCWLLLLSCLQCLPAFFLRCGINDNDPRKSEEYKKKKEEAKKFLYAAVSKQVPDLEDAQLEGGWKWLDAGFHRGMAFCVFVFL